MKNYIIIESNTDNDTVLFYRFYGEEEDMLLKMLNIARVATKEEEFDEAEVPETIYDIVLDGYEFSRCFSAKEFDEIALI